MEVILLKSVVFSLWDNSLVLLIWIVNWLIQKDW